MKRIISLAFICLSLVQLIAQNLPQGIAYQAVAVKDGPYSLAGQNPQAIYWSNKDIKVRFTIYEKYPGGSTQYSEFHATKTDDYGLFNLIIGQGNPISGDFTKIPWDLGTAHLQVEIDFDNNGTYKLTSLERFWSVPYAFVTRKSSSTSTDSALNALNSKFNYLKNRDKDTVIGNEGGVSYKSLDSLNKVLLAKLAALKASDKDTVIGNEWQKLTRNKDTLILSDGGGKVTLLDEDSKNELQDLVLTNDSLTMTKSSKSIDLGPLVKSIISSTMSSSSSTSSNSSYNDCFSGVAIDLTQFCNANGYVKTIFLGKYSDSICVFSAKNSSSVTDVYTINTNSKNIQVLSNNMDLNATNTLVKDSILYGGTGTIYLCNIKRRKWLDTINGISPMLDMRNAVITKSNDLISIQVTWSSSPSGWLVGNYCKYNFATKKITNPTNPNNGQISSNWFCTYIGGDTVLLGDRVVNAKTMIEIFQIKKLSQGNYSVIVWNNRIYFNYNEVTQPDPNYKIYSYSRQIVSINPKTQIEEILIKVNYGLGTSSTFSTGGSTFIGINNNRLLVSEPGLDVISSSPPRTNWRLNNMTCTSPSPIYWIDTNNYLSLFGYYNPVEQYQYRQPYLAFDFNGTPMCVNGSNLSYKQGFFCSSK
jgi:hypothetical protein